MHSTYSPGVMEAAEPYDGDQVALPLDLNAENAKAGFLAVEGDTLDGTGEAFMGSVGFLGLLHEFLFFPKAFEITTLAEGRRVMINVPVFFLSPRNSWYISPTYYQATALTP